MSKYTQTYLQRNVPPFATWPRAVPTDKLTAQELTAMEGLGIKPITKRVFDPVGEEREVNFVAPEHAERIFRFSKLTPRQQLATLMEEMVARKRDELVLLNRILAFTQKVKEEQGVNVFKEVYPHIQQVGETS